MKKFFVVLLSLALFIPAIANEIPAFYSVKSKEKANAAKTALNAKLKAANFKILGTYSPMNNTNMFVVAITRADIQKLTNAKLAISSLASVLKFGIAQVGGQTEISLLNPEYIFNAYLQDKIEGKDQNLSKISNELISILKSLGTNFSSFGGKMDADNLQDYHYMFGMPYLKDYVKLNEAGSFSEACAKIESNLPITQGAKKVFQIKYVSQQVAIYGIALNDNTKGESFFLKKIGSRQIAALPYEIVVLGNKAIMLHGRYRLALHWPELTMGQFMEIVDTPGYVEDVFKKIAE